MTVLKPERPRGRKRWPTRPTSNNGPRRGRKRWLTSYVRGPDGRTRWPTRPTSYVRQPRGRKRWRTKPTSDAGPTRGRKSWPTRPTSNVGWPRGRNCWPMRSTSNVADRQLRSTANPRRHVAAADLVFVLVAAMAPEPPIHISTFFVVGNIGPELPTNLL